MNNLLKVMYLAMVILVFALSTAALGSYVQGAGKVSRMSKAVNLAPSTPNTPRGLLEAACDEIAVRTEDHDNIPTKTTNVFLAGSISTEGFCVFSHGATPFGLHFYWNEKEWYVVPQDFN
jgi:hypothetical protein